MMPKQGCYQLGLLVEQRVDIVTAKTSYDKACDSGNGIVEACTKAQDGSEAVCNGGDGDLDECFKFATSIKTDDPEKAKPIFEKVCTRGQARGCLSRSTLVYNANTMAKEEWQGKACTLNDLSTCLVLAALETNDYGHSLELYVKSCDGGSGEALGCSSVNQYKTKHENLCKTKGDGTVGNLGEGNLEDCVWLGVIKEAEGNSAGAKTLYTLACTGTVPVGCLRLGLLELGAGNNNDAKTAFTTACSNDSWPGCYQLGLFEETVNTDQAAANTHYEKACTGEYGLACKKRGSVESTDDDKKPWYYKACNFDHFDGCTKAAPLYQSACDNGVIQECFFLGSVKVKLDMIVDAKTSYDTACTGGHTEACHRIGFEYLKERDFPNAEKYYELGCDNTVDPFYASCVKWGDLLLGKDVTKAEQLYDKACKGGNDSINGLGCFKLAVRYQSKGDSAKTEQSLEDACTRKHYYSCLKRGDMKVRDAGVETDPVNKVKLYGEAQPWFQKACDGDNIQGCYMFGRMTEIVEKRKAGATDASVLAAVETALKKACDGRHELGCSRLGDLQHVAGETANATTSYKKGCELDHERSCGNYGVLIKSTDSVAARAAFNEACKGGSAAKDAWLDGCYMLAMMDKTDTLPRKMNAKALFDLLCISVRYPDSVKKRNSCTERDDLAAAGISYPPGYTP